MQSNLNALAKKIKRNHIVEKDFIRFAKRRGKYVVFTCQ